MQKITRQDILFMKRALELAKKGIGSVHPNPLVGAVLVQNGRIIGEGAHERFGGPHAEVNAVKKAKQNLKNATLYVSLEPCGHTGKTPPCADFILSRGVKKVMVGAKDPNPLVSGKGLKKLKKAGVQVTTGILEKEAMDLNRDFNYWMRFKKPYGIVKIAQSLDGKIATKKGESKWISGAASRELAHRLRASSDAILIGVNTLLADNPRLSVRLPGKNEAILKESKPLKIIVDSHLKTPVSSRIFSGTPKERILLAVTSKAPLARRRLFKNKAEILTVKAKNGRVDLKELFSLLGKRGIVSILIEGGGEVIADAFAEKLVREAYFFIASKIIGGKAAPGSVGGAGIAQLKKAYQLKKVSVLRLGQDFLVHGVF